VCVVDHHDLLHDVKQEKAHHERDHRVPGRRTVMLDLVDDLGKDVEAHHAEEHPGGEPHGEIEAAPVADAEESAERRRDECPDRPEDRCQQDVTRRAPRVCSHASSGQLVRLMMWNPNGVSTTSEIWPICSFHAGCSNSGTIIPLLKVPRSPLFSWTDG